jgi:hypothetical protein
MISLTNTTKLLVIGDVHEHPEQFNKVIDYLDRSSNTILVSVGDIFDKGFGENVGYEILNKIRDLHNQNKAYLVKGNHELKKIRLAKRNNEFNQSLEWLDRQPISLQFNFTSGNLVTILHAGILQSHSLEDLKNDISISYIRTIGNDGKMIPMVKKEVDGVFKFVERSVGKSWHELYDGRFGYIIAGHDPQEDGIPKFYNYSANIDTCVFKTGLLTGLIYSSKGKEDIVQFSGESFENTL